MAAIQMARGGSAAGGGKPDVTGPGAGHGGGHHGAGQSDWTDDADTTDTTGTTPGTTTGDTTGTTPGTTTDDSTTTDAPTWPTIEASVDGLLDAFDADDDGSITLDEIAGVLDPGGHHPEIMNAVVRGLIALIDTDTDGVLTEAEVTTAITHLDTNADGSLSPDDLGPELAHDGLAPLLAVLLQGPSVPGSGGAHPPPPEPPAEHPAPTLAQVVDALTARFDANADEALTLTELLAVLDPKGKHAKVDAALASLVDAVDADHDGAMSQAELTAAVGTLDHDGNGTIDHRDHVPGPPADDGVDLIGVLLPHLRDFDAMVLGQTG